MAQNLKFLAEGTATDGSKYNLYIDELITSEPSISLFKVVDEKEFWSFIGSYPNKLEVDEFMDSASWNDFTTHPKWPESMVAILSYGRHDLNIPDTYKILK